jgi:hypothetical protein
MATVDDFKGNPIWTEDFDDPSMGNVYSDKTFTDAQIDLKDQSTYANAVGDANAHSDAILATEATNRLLGDTTVCTSGTRPTGGSVYVGKTIYETDTKRLMVYNLDASGNFYWGYTSPFVIAKSIQYSAPTTFTTVETVLLPATGSFTTIAGRRYRLKWFGRYKSTVATDTMTFNIRDSGTNVAPTTAGAILASEQVDLRSGLGVPFYLEATFDCVASGATTGQINAGTHYINLFGIRATGTGTCQLEPSTARECGYRVEDRGTY